MEEILDPGLVVGVGSMDHEHEHMAYLVREFGRSVRLAFAPDAVGSLLDVLLAATREHFAAEEQLMAKYRYPREDAHKAAHAALLEDLKTLATQNGNHALEVSAAQSLEKWLAHHIVTLDRDLGEHITAAGASEAARRSGPRSA